MEAKYVPFELVQGPFADEIEIRREFFSFPSPDVTALPADADFQRRPADRFLPGGAFYEPVVANPEY
jgi:hypothetical protein